MGMSSGKGQHRLDGSEHDETWAGRMRRELRPELGTEVDLPAEVRSDGARRITEHLIAAPPPQPVSDQAAPPYTDHEAWKQAVADYNRERVAAYQAYRLAFDGAWAEYHSAMCQANAEYEVAVATAAEQYDKAMTRDADR